MHFMSFRCELRHLYAAHSCQLHRNRFQYSKISKKKIGLYQYELFSALIQTPNCWHMLLICKMFEKEPEKPNNGLTTNLSKLRSKNWISCHLTIVSGNGVPLLCIDDWLCNFVSNCRLKRKFKRTRYRYTKATWAAPMDKKRTKTAFVLNLLCLCSLI